MKENIISENACIAQDQVEYQERYDGLVERYNTAKARYNGVARTITEKKVQNERLADFFKILKTQDGIIAESEKSDEGDGLLY